MSPIRSMGALALLSLPIVLIVVLAVSAVVYISLLSQGATELYTLPFTLKNYVAILLSGFVRSTIVLSIVLGTIATFAAVVLGYVGALYFIGDADGFFAAMPTVIASGEPFDVEVLFSDRGRALRRDARFVPLMTQLKLVAFWEGVLLRIPVVNSIYKAVKQVSDTLFSGSGQAFRKVLLVRYPHPEAWSLAFQTNVPTELTGHFDAEHVAVFIPTTPSPVNGFYFYVKRSEVVELDMSVDEALKYIISMGVVTSDNGDKPRKAVDAPAAPVLQRAVQSTAANE